MENKKVETTKWDVIKYVSEHIGYQEQLIGFCENKIKTKEPYLGDPRADLEGAKHKLVEFKIILDKLLKAK